MIPLYKEDCKWYDFWQDMGARIPFCKIGKNMDASGFFLETCDGCKDYGNKNVTTNADRIRAMSDEELAEFLERVADGCDSCPMLKECTYSDGEMSGEQVRVIWLKQEAGE